ncbi:CHC2 zinc finger domain-containing protein [uncultured Ruminococcus sp.]|uniref:CHC2 zinc finger domain-containing protein n=1 Tax=uncultured Ruminococcus sp. TaxID=165186 RepID=UPI0025CCC570|nr:CHC2 zinc finger domain-containing protein [uncultured Ruminococcus sp.]
MNFNSDRREEIKSRVTIADVIRKYSPSSEIKKDVIRCPFHSERTASFRIYQRNNSFYCFGCGIGGDQINFVAKILDISYYDALKRVDEDFMLGVFSRKISKSTLQKRIYERERKQFEEEKAKLKRQAEENKLINFFKELRNRFESESDNIKLKNAIIFVESWLNGKMDIDGVVTLLPKDYSADEIIENVKENLK